MYYKDVQLLFICLLYSVKEGPVVETVERDLATLKIITTIKKCQRIYAINFSVSPYCTLLFSRKKNIKFSEVVLVAVVLVVLAAILQRIFTSL